MNSSVTRRVLSAVAAALAGGAGILFGSTAAHAADSTVKVVNGVFTFTAANGEANDVTIIATMDDHLNVGDVAGLDAGVGCTQLGPDGARCTGGSNVTEMDIRLGDRKDRVTVRAAYAKTVDGGADDDYIYSYSMQFTPSGEPTTELFGGPGTDTIEGGTGRDFIKGGPGNDILSGNEGDDVILGETGNDTLLGDAGKDRLLDGYGDNTLRGGDGNDDVSVFEVDRALSGHGKAYGDAGNDVLQSGWLSDELDGGAGTDTISYVRHLHVPVTVDLTKTTAVQGAYQENDTLRAFENIAAPFIGPGLFMENVLTGDAGRNTITGNVGKDIITGNGGDDTLLAGYGDDTVYGGTGEDEIVGGPGIDQLYGNDHDDVISAGEARQSDATTPDRDTLRCGAGSDTYYVTGTVATLNQCEVRR